MPGFTNDSLLSRRDLLKAAAGATVLIAGATNINRLGAQSADKLKLGVIGCGGRGTYDTTQCLKAAPNVELVAAGDLFQDQLDEYLATIKKKFEGQFKVTPDTAFVGWDAIDKVLAAGPDLVILTTPPAFRPAHFRSAVNANKHVFMEKPVAVDPVGAQHVIETAKMADEKGLKVAVGTQARKMDHRIEMRKRMLDGQIGDILCVKCVRTGGSMGDWGMQERKPEMSDMEWQVRRWLFHTWLSGDFIAEMHIHELDIVSWMLQDAEPEKLRAFGARSARPAGDLFGDSYDQYSAVYEYPNDLQVTYMGNQIDGTSATTFERFYGTKGVAYTDWSGSKITGENPWTFEGESNNPVITQHQDHVKAILENTPYNDAARVAKTTMLAIAGRMSAYSAKEIKYSWALNASKLSIVPENLSFDSAPKIEIPVPGKVALI